MVKKAKHALIILGAGPAGLTAALYAARYKLDFITIGRVAGGYMMEAHEVENFPGTGKISGPELSQKIFSQLKDLEHEPVRDDIQAIKKENGTIHLYGATEEYKTTHLILALGTERKQLNIPGEQEFLGKGVSYCATCDGFFFKEKTAAVIGGGDSALTAALYLGDVADKVYLIARKDELAGDPSWQEKIRTHKNIETVLGTNVEEICGNEKVEKIILDNGPGEIAVDGVFIEIGLTPSSALLDNLGVSRDEKNYIIVDSRQKTNIPGVWAAGDATTASNKLKQIVTACSEGAVAATDIFQEIKKQK